MKLVIFLVIVFVGIAIFSWVRSLPAMRRGTVAITVGQTVFAVEVVDTPSLRARGLSGHAPLGKKEGMLFEFNTPTKDPFWMQGMLFPIDFVWIARGEVVGVTENARPMSETGFMVYPPPMFVDQVLEVNAGAVEKFGIKVGDAVRYK